MRHSSFLEVNLSYLGENYQKIKALATKAEVLPMVKADAYGNGLTPISRFLSEECGVKKLGCARVGEAIRLFHECPHFLGELMVFSDTELHDEKMREAYLNLRITPVIHQRSDLDIFLSLPEFKKIPLVLKINTGMNRLGLTLDELAQVLPKLKGRGVDHLMTHLACSYYPLKAGDKSHRQLDEFRKAQKILANANVEVRETSIANSGAIEQSFGVDETYVRPGLMLYGPPSVEPVLWNGKQISRLVTKVLKTFMVKKGTPVGYGINVAGEDCLMVVIPIGYGDGISTFTSGTSLRIKGHKGKVFGRVNMDMTYIAFDPSLAGEFKEGESIDFWTHNNRDILEMANQMKTHPYQIMCGISSTRIPRIYKVN